MKNILLSIIVPCYNAASYIELTLASVWKQDFHDYELILINDGSDDGTLSILRRYEMEKENVVVVNQSNKGVSIARNEGLKVAQGKYVCFLDSDDFFCEDIFSYFIKCMNVNHDIDLFSYGYYWKRNKGKIHRLSSSKYSNTIFSGQDFLKLFYQRKLYVHIGSFFVKRDVLLSNRVSFLPNCKIGEDICFIIQMIQSVHAVYYNSKDCLEYTVRNDSTMKGYRFFDIINFSHLNAIENLKEDFDDLKKYKNLFVSVTYISLLIRYILYGKSNTQIDDLFLMKQKNLFLCGNGFSFHYILICFFRKFPLRLLFRLKYLLCF